jgi:hypothetical protein
VSRGICLIVSEYIAGTGTTIFRHLACSGVSRHTIISFGNRVTRQETGQKKTPSQETVPVEQVSLFNDGFLGSFLGFLFGALLFKGLGRSLFYFLLGILAF